MSRAKNLMVVAVSAPPRCDFHDAHDADERPTGNRCPKPATHRIIWNDGKRFSFGCDDHLEIDADASVKPAAIEPLEVARG